MVNIYIYYRALLFQQDCGYSGDNDPDVKKILDPDPK